MFVMVFSFITVAINDNEIHAQESQNPRFEESIGSDTIYNTWILAVRYRFEEISDNYSINQDPKMKAIWNLRGNDLHYFLDFIEAINWVQTIVFPASSSNSESVQNITLAAERELIEVVTAQVFSSDLDAQNKEDLSETDKVYITELEIVLNAILQGDGDRYFTPEYLQYRDNIIPFIEDTDAELFNPSQEAVDEYLKYFGIKDEQSADLSLNQVLQSCTTVYTINNWPAKSATFSGNTGSSWREARAHDQNDCDIFVSYYMGSTPYYGRVSANTSSAQCVLDKTSQLRGAWVGNFNNVQYGKITVTWGWPFGCNTTGNALRSATKWRP
jgi:hypothetical protein